MIDLSVLKGSSYVVLGLARSGLTTVRALVAAGVEYAAWDDNEVSRRHAELRPADGAHVIVDLTSSNGTFVNGKKVTKVMLADGDNLTVGRVTFVVNAQAGRDSGDPKTT